MRAYEDFTEDQENGAVIFRKERMSVTWDDRKGNNLPSHTEVEEPAGSEKLDIDVQKAFGEVY